MRFLIFNGVVIAALVYLFNADRADLQTAAHTAIDKAQSAATQVVASARETVERDTAAPPPVPAQPLVEAEAAPEPAPPPVEVIAEPAPQKVVTPETPPVVATPETVAESPEPEPRKGTLPAEAPAPQPLKPHAPTRVAAADPAPPPAPEQWVPERTTATVDYSAAKPKLPTDDPAALSRRAEILGEPAPAASEPAKKVAEYAIAEGETLMTPRQRRKELSHLAEDMEMLFLEKLNR